MSTALPQIVYVVGAILGSFFLAVKSRTGHPIVAGLIAFWILGGSIINQDIFLIRLPAFAGDLQVGRIIFIALFVYLAATIILRLNRKEVSAHPRFERYFYAYFACMFLVMGYHLFGGTLTAREFVKVVDGLLRVLVTYLVLKRYADTEMIKVIFRSLLAVAAISTVVAVLQFFWNPYFLRVGDSILAFGGIMRPNGVFSSEYLHSYSCVVALIITLVTIESRRLRVFLVPLYLAGILLSFHRMSWIVTLIVLAVYAFYSQRKYLGRLALGISMAVLCVYVASSEFTPLLERFQSTDFFQSRLTSNTLDSRQKLYAMVISRFDQIGLWGAGTKQSDLYYFGILDTGVNSNWARGVSGSIHNLYLEILFLYGLPTTVAFCATLLSMLWWYREMMRRLSRFFLIPLLFTVMFIIMNLTNAFPLQGTLGYLFAILIGVSSSAPVTRTLHVREADAGS